MNRRDESSVAHATSNAGPDLKAGIELNDIPDGGAVAGTVEGEPILLSRFGEELFAVGGVCTHYGGTLADGLVEHGTARCPLHHACFDLKTGAALRAPALDPLVRWQVEVDGDRAFVRTKAEAADSPAQHPQGDVRSVVIVGGGAAGLACANELRRLGFAGSITILSADRDPPCDRPNLSKDYLAGAAPEEWLWLRGEDWYADNDVDLHLSTEVSRIDAPRQTVHCASGETFTYDRLLIATGCEPNRLLVPGFDAPNVLTLRSVADARAIAAQAKPGSRAVIVGASFIALEAAAALRRREIEVEIVSVEEVPLDRVFGTELGHKLQQLHETNGVRFHLSAVVGGFDGKSVKLASGAAIDADFIVVGIGVKPRTAVAQSAGARIENGVMVDEFLETGVPGIYAAGDIAAYPDPLTGERIRIEHWVTAERQGQAVARNMLGEHHRFAAVPFFWTEQYGVPIRYVGRAVGWDAVTLDGELDNGSLVARYFAEGRHCATATIGRDRENLEDERVLEELAHAREEQGQ
jgi:NADPH-dependent 2,4-dienoyl-CoA reductase/sulfur reductase-like enzyme/nitrite reductase/ring-hydroxylating ferredoxin subunit